MKPLTNDEIKRWRVEIQNTEDFRDDHFGKKDFGDRTLAAENILYYEQGLPSKLISEVPVDGHPAAVFNVISPIVDNIIPTLSSKNPYILSLPKRNNDDDEVSAPIAGEIINYRYKELGLKDINKMTIWNGYVLGIGVSKIGYTTKFGLSPNADTEKETKKEIEKGRLQKFKEAVGLSKPKKEETVENPEKNEFIRSESSFVIDIDPFRFGIDPRANFIEEADFVFEKVTKILDKVKSNKDYKNTSNLEGGELDEDLVRKIPKTQHDFFKTIDLYEIHYKTDEGINILTLAADGDNWKELEHKKSVYEMDGYQYELLYFNKHPHLLYPMSDISKIKGLQDRISQTIENILEQVDKYVPKIGIDETALTDGGKNSLRDGGIGAFVGFNKSPREAIMEIGFTQVKADLFALIDKVLDIVMLMTGLTKAQLLGITTADTATEAQIGQSGSNLRTSEKFDKVNDFLTRQARKLWQVEKQFSNLEEISLIVGQSGVSQEGIPTYSWLPDIDSEMSDKLAKGEYRFEVVMGSTERPDLPILRKQIENLINIIGGEGVLQVIAAQGFKIELVEILREYLDLFPNMFKNKGRIIKPIGQQVPGQPGQPQQGAGLPANTQQLQEAPPNIADIASQVGGEAQGGQPIA